MAKDKISDDQTSHYAVGYKKPPRHTQFKPGRSGNTNGRPKNNTTLVDAFLNELRTPVNITIGAKTKRITMTEVIAKQIINMAAKGDAKATAVMLSVLKPAENNQDNNLPELLQEFRENNARHLAAERRPKRRKPGRGK